jgi:hypothetical protein
MKTQGSYLGTINTGFLVLLAAHVPVCCAVAMYFDSGFWLAAILGTLSLAAPALMYLSDRESRSTSVALGISAMCFSALLIHLSGGMVEMHFHIFTMLALMIAFRFPWPLVCGAVTIAVHHVLFFIWLPHSLFDHHGSWSSRWFPRSGSLTCWTSPRPPAKPTRPNSKRSPARFVR